MSYVSSYILITYEDEVKKAVEDKLTEILSEERDDPAPIILQRVELNSVGNKGCQFKRMYAFAFNYFDNERFQSWYKARQFQKEDAQLLFKGEYDESCRFV